MYLYEKMVIENKEIPIDDGKSLGNLRVSMTMGLF